MNLLTKINSARKSYFAEPNPQLVLPKLIRNEIQLGNNLLTDEEIILKEKIPRELFGELNFIPTYKLPLKQLKEAKKAIKYFTEKYNCYR